MGKVYIMNRILCSTGALIGRPNGRNFRLLGECAEKLDCDGFEFMMYDDWYACPDALAECLNGIDKPFPSFHTEKDVGELISRNEEGDSEKALELFERDKGLFHGTASCMNIHCAMHIITDSSALQLTTPTKRRGGVPGFLIVFPKMERD